jgi:iron complex outermembrane receptor protein
LVLIDGRSVYTPLFSGVFWNIQDIMLEDIERIEVIRGPGATLWGANAVNGVINIITKNASETQGGLASTTVGTEQRVKSTFRYGSKIGDDLYYRAYIQHSEHDDFVDRFKNDAADEWGITRGGFRMDWEPEPEDHITFLGGGYVGRDGTTFRLPIVPAPYFQNIDVEDDIWGFNILSKWEHTLSDQSDFYLQTYYDKNVRDSIVVGEDRDTVDLEFQHRYDFENAHELVWGLGYRFTTDEVADSLSLTFRPQQRDRHLFQSFVQDEITIFEDELRWIIGTKVEHNEYTGFEFQPNTRLIWTPHERHTFWASISRAVRTPSRLEFDAKIDLETILPGDPRNPFVTPVYTVALGNKDFASEELMSYELGYRTFISDSISIDAAAFYNVYDSLRNGDFISLNPAQENGIPYLITELLADNYLSGETYGFELSSRIQVQSWWNIQLAFTALDIQIHTDLGHFDAGQVADEWSSPNYQFTMLQSFDLPKNVELDFWLRYVTELPNYQINDILSMDVRLGLQPTKNLNISFCAQNLLDQQHEEFTRSYFINSLPTEIERSYYAKLTYTW